MLVENFTIGGRSVGKKSPVFIIAEAGVNHNGNIDLALKLIREAKRCGADCVKFQTFSADELVSPKAPKAAYQLKSTDPHESQREMLHKLELPKHSYKRLIKLCNTLRIVFLSTPYNFSDVDFLASLGVPAFKLASIHLTELPMIRYTAKRGKPVILSTGIATLKEVRTAAETFKRSSNNKLALLQCTTDYPAKLEEANLGAMKTIEKTTGAVVGYSDNSDTIEACILAVAAGARIIEKHFTLDKTLPGPDHAASANPMEFSEMVRRIREAERMLGSGTKVVTKSERRNIIGMKRSLASTVLIRKGTRITRKMLTFKRPATGIPPNQYENILGKKAMRNITEGSIIRRKDIT